MRAMFATAFAPTFARRRTGRPLRRLLRICRAARRPIYTNAEVPPAGYVTNRK